MTPVIDEALQRALEPIKRGTLALLLNQKRLRTLLLDPWTGSRRTEVENTKVCDSTLDYYELKSSDGFRDMFNHHSPPFSGFLFRLAHIWPSTTLGAGLDQFDLQESDVNQPRNCMYLPRTVEEAFDRKRCTFEWDFLHQRIFFNVLDPDLLEEYIFFDTKKGGPIGSKRFKDLNGNHLVLPAKKFPYRRLLDWHSKRSHWMAKQRGWTSEDVDHSRVSFGRVSFGKSQTGSYLDTGELDVLCASMQNVELALAAETKVELESSAHFSDNEDDESSSPLPPTTVSKSKRRRRRKGKSRI